MAGFFFTGCGGYLNAGRCSSRPCDCALRCGGLAVVYFSLPRAGRWRTTAHTVLFFHLGTRAGTPASSRSTSLLNDTSIGPNVVVVVKFRAEPLVCFSVDSPIRCHSSPSPLVRLSVSVPIRIGVVFFSTVPFIAIYQPLSRTTVGQPDRQTRATWGELERLAFLGGSFFFAAASESVNGEEAGGGRRRKLEPDLPISRQRCYCLCFFRYHSEIVKKRRVSLLGDTGEGESFRLPVDNFHRMRGKKKKTTAAVPFIGRQQSTVSPALDAGDGPLFHRIDSTATELRWETRRKKGPATATATATATAAEQSERRWRQHPSLSTSGPSLCIRRTHAALTYFGRPVPVPVPLSQPDRRQPLRRCFCRCSRRDREREREREGWGDLVSPWTWTCFLQEVQVSHSAWNELGCGIEATRENNRFTELGLGDEVLRVFTRFSCFPYVLFSRFLAITRPLPGFTGLCCMRLRSDGCVGKREFAVQCVRLSFRAEQRTMGVCQNNRNGDAK